MSVSGWGAGMQKQAWVDFINQVKCEIQSALNQKSLVSFVDECVTYSSNLLHTFDPVSSTIVSHFINAANNTSIHILKIIFMLVDLT